MRRYFQEFYQLREVDLDYPVKGSTETLAPMLFEGTKNRHRISDTPLLLVARHRTVADNFHVIEQLQYTISIYNHERQALEQSGGIVSLLDGRLLVLQPTAYDEQYGLNLSQDSEMQSLFM